MKLSESVASIHEVFCRWRQLGSRELASGMELIGPFEVDGETMYLHVLHAGMDAQAIASMEDALQVKLPRWLRAFYSRYGGMDLWNGAFVVFGRPSGGYRWPRAEPAPSDIVMFNHMVSCLPWFPANHLAFAQNGLDMSVFLASLTGDEILRCDLSTGQVVEVFDDLFCCIDARLNKLDKVVLGAETA